jgi:hypothetical protein
MKDVYLRGDSFLGHPMDIAIIVAWGLVGAAIASRLFGCDPREQLQPLDVEIEVRLRCYCERGHLSLPLTPLLLIARV